jgi:DNA-binding IclR family transcriptional regulator
VVGRPVDQGAGERGRPVTARALDLLGGFDAAHRRMTLTELAARAGLPMALGACSVAVPVREADGTVVAAVGVVVPSTRRDLVRLVPALQVAAHGITRHLGQFH